jgi:hypothetical protein
LRPAHARGHAFENVVHQLALRNGELVRPHSSLQATMDRYGHLFKSDDHKKAMDAIAVDMFA